MADDWRKSGYSNGQAQCVEVGRSETVIAVRDTADREGGTLAFTAAAWRAFTASLR